VSKFYGNAILVTTACIITFWIFMALHEPVKAGWHTTVGGMGLLLLY